MNSMGTSVPGCQLHWAVDCKDFVHFTIFDNFLKNYET